MNETPNPQRSLPGGYRLHEYEIECELGSGGFGITYLARDLNLHREVVIKENLPTFAFRDTNSSRVYPNSKHGEEAELFEWSLDNFVAEARTLARFDHPTIVRILRVFEANGTAYFVMPHLEGKAFDTIIEERKAAGKPFGGEELRALLDPLLGALEELHAAGFYHRDIKPANLLLTGRGPVLIDFGAARQQTSEKSLTVVESPGYTPFEQMQTKGNVGPWSDLYGLAAVLYRALTFEAPPKAMDRVGGDPIRVLAEDAELLKRCSRGFLESVDRCLAFEFGDRPQSVAEWRAMLDGGGSVRQTAPKPKPVKDEKDGKGRRIGMALAALAVLGLVAVGAWLAVTAPWNAAVTLTSEPAGAVLTIDGEEKGTMPLRLNLPPGPHSLQVRLDPWPVQRREVAIEAGRSLEESFVFEPATVALSGEPAGVRVSFGGAAEEALPLTKELPPGVYVFEARYRNWPVQQREVKVTAGEAVDLAVRFEPVSVLVESEPMGAEVSDAESGRILGTTPLELTQSEPGPVKWELALAGHESARLDVELEPGSNGPYAVDLRALMEGTRAGEERDFGGITMVWCPPGEFLMGSPAGETDRSSDETQHRVTLTKGFWLAKTECTQGQWGSVMGTDVAELKRTGVSDKTYGYINATGPDVAMYFTSWDDAQKWLQKMNSEKPLPSGWKWVLPTEAQWEYACRAGKETAFHFGSVLNGREANCDGNNPYGTSVKGAYLEKTAKVGSYAANAWGLYDMHGNVWEWCADKYGEYASGSATDPTGATGGADRVNRGGGWNGDARSCRSANRDGTKPDIRYDNLGFRLAASFQEAR